MRQFLSAIASFGALFFFCHGLGAFLIPQIFDSIEIALSISLLISLAVTIVVMSLHYLGVFDKKKTDTSNVLDDPKDIK